MTNRERDIEQFYSLLADLETVVGGKRKLKDCRGRMNWPKKGVYFFFEEEEVRQSNPHDLRVVRVGTHAVSKGAHRTLWARLREHRGQRDGSGRHGVSVFRYHIGQALIAQSNGAIEAPTWGQKGRRELPKSERAGEFELERQVSNYIGVMPFLWVAVDDEAGTQSDRAKIEKNSIILLAGNDGQTPQDPPSPHWLGKHSKYAQIQHSGLWNVDYVAKPEKHLEYKPDFLQTFVGYIESMKTH